MKRVVFSGRVKMPKRDHNGALVQHLWAWVYDDASVEVAAGVGYERCAPTPEERIDALEAAVRTMKPIEIDYDSILLSIMPPNCRCVTCGAEMTCDRSTTWVHADCPSGTEGKLEWYE